MSLECLSIEKSDFEIFLLILELAFSLVSM